ncbi:Spo0E family sporulation regulatory protein-aspartic acid phosphatase [Sporosalibacterium faouarense]|uniref:Spo0E family sporulation regulatory protein-aspartic acid phosphatase n=1 Tax=Sporosalibacterium faouarense TaxID=516123 RepID=UPI001A9C7D6B|nr:Spo0E family sporulation regulatory protein-aspartic acid phosphatase [Sporosalibacterium faouarense]
MNLTNNIKLKQYIEIIYKIENQRYKLNTAIDQNKDYNEIYGLSVQLDELLVSYYRLR